jgi:hypothetical protein
MRTETLDDLLRTAVRRLPKPCEESVRRTAVRLDDGGVWSAHPATVATRLRCASGALWVTQDGMPDDVVVHAGESFDARAGGKVVVQALDHDATFWVE